VLQAVEEVLVKAVVVVVLVEKLKALLGLVVA